MNAKYSLTGQEILIKDNAILISKTDSEGKITYVNDDFIKISGFKEQELLGADYNIVRHPDIPEEVFIDLWDKVKQGQPWRRILKNKSKSGDYYWLTVNITPLFVDGGLKELLSIAYSPSREQITAAESLYDNFGNHNAGSGVVEFLKKINFIKKLSIKSKLIIFGLLFLIPAILSTVLFVKEKDLVIDFSSQEVLGTQYHEPLMQLLMRVCELNGLLNENASQNAAANEAALVQAGKNIDAAIDTVNSVDIQYAEVLKSTETWTAIKNNWLSLQAEHQSPAALELIEKQNKFIESIYKFVTEINDSSNLMLDPDLDSFWLMDMNEVFVPEFMERLTFLRGYIALNYHGQPFSDQQKIEFVSIYKLSQRLFDKVKESSAKAFKFNDVVAASLNDDYGRMETDVQKYLDNIRLNLIESNDASIPADEFYKQGSAAINQSKALYDLGSVNLKQLLKNRIDKYQSEKANQLILVSAFVITALLVGFFIIGYVSDNVKNILFIFNKLKEGDFKNSINLDNRDEFGEILKGLHGLQAKLCFDLTNATDQAKKMLVIKQALNNVHSCVMITDNNLDITYMNNSVNNMFKQVEADIRKQFQDFKLEGLIGSNISQFDAYASHRRDMLESLADTLKSNVIVGDIHLELTANPVITDSGEKIGAVVEWLDRSNEIKIEKEIAGIVDAVKAGGLSKRIGVADKHGFFQKLSEGINELSDVIEMVFADINRSMESMAAGDLTNRITRDYSGVYLQSKNDINFTIDKLKDIFEQIHAAADSINNSAKEIANGNSNLSHRVEQQAANLQQTAASLEELTGTVKNNAANAQEANQLANLAKESAENGGKVVANAIAAIREINESSIKIAEIISVIDEIAFQTNLLALNASVEAARAGEQGRGFSVVATEVRNLAKRCATAAGDSKELIQNTVKKVNTGTEYVNATGAALSEIVSAVKKVGDIVSEIAAASVEQSAGISQVNQAVSNMDEMTQQNAALAEQTLAVSISMSNTSNDMLAVLEFFKHGNDEVNYFD
ncbi:MAG: methyl-accepting chemotaxis protein [Methylomonas sp.]|jgi:methyl-accepting chemotaxis protein